MTPLSSRLVSLCLLALAGSPATAQRAVDLCPSDATLILSIPQLGRSIDRARDAIEMVCAHPMLSAKLARGLEEMSEEIGFNPLQKATWKAIGVDVERDAAFFLHFGQKDEESDFEPMFSVIVPLADEESFVEFLHQIVSRGGKREVEWRDVEGLEGAKQPFREGYDGEIRAEEMVLAMRDGYAIVAGSDDEDLCADAARLALRNQSSPTSSATWKRSVEMMKGQDLFCSIRFARFFELLEEDMERQAKSWRKRAEEGEEWARDIAEKMDDGRRQIAWTRKMFRTFGDVMVMSLGVSETGMKLQGLMEGEGLEAMSIPIATGPVLDALIPAEPLLFYRYSVNPSALEEMLSGMPTDFMDGLGDGFEGMLEQANELLGIDLIEDVWSKFTGRIQLSIAVPSEGMMNTIVEAIEARDMDESTALGLLAQTEATIAIELSDMSGILEMIANLKEMIEEESPLEVRATEGEGVRTWFVGPPGRGEQAIDLGGVAITNDTLIVGTAVGIRNGLRRLADSAKPSIPIPEIQQRLPQPSCNAFFFDLRPVHHLLSRMAESTGSQEMAIAESMLGCMHSLSMYSETKKDLSFFSFEVKFL